MAYACAYNLTHQSFLNKVRKKSKQPNSIAALSTSQDQQLDVEKSMKNDKIGPGSNHAVKICYYEDYLNCKYKFRVFNVIRL